MPELPEVETVCRGLAASLVNATITSAETRAHLRHHPEPSELQDFCQGRTIHSIRRRAKYILVTFAENDGLLLHLGMTGAFKIDGYDGPPEKHAHVIWRLADGRSWRFLDPRRFGAIFICRQDLDKSVPPPLANLGPEPLTADFTPAGLYTATRNRNTPIKNFIMAQENVVGVGNIYASEALFRARLSPLKPASTLSRTACRNLTAAIKAVLTEAIAAGGTTISDFHALDGSEGKFTVALQVYGRNGQPCPVCGQAIQRLVIAGGSSFFCKKCQKP